MAKLIDDTVVGQVYSHYTPSLKPTSFNPNEPTINVTKSVFFGVGDQSELYSLPVTGINSTNSRNNAFLETNSEDTNHTISLVDFQKIVYSENILMYLSIGESGAGSSFITMGKVDPVKYFRHNDSLIINYDRFDEEYLQKWGNLVEYMSGGFKSTSWYLYIVVPKARPVYLNNPVTKKSIVYANIDGFCHQYWRFSDVSRIVNYQCSINIRRYENFLKMDLVKKDKSVYLILFAETRDYTNKSLIRHNVTQETKSKDWKFWPVSTICQLLAIKGTNQVLYYNDEWRKIKQRDRFKTPEAINKMLTEISNGDIPEVFLSSARSSLHRYYKTFISKIVFKLPQF